MGVVAMLITNKIITDQSTLVAVFFNKICKASKEFILNLVILKVEYQHLWKFFPDKKLIIPGPPLVLRPVENQADVTW